MLVLPKKTSHPLHTDSILAINRVTSRAEDYTGIHNINRVTQSESLSSAEAAPFTVSRASETPMSSRVSNPSPSYRRSAQQNTFTSSAPSGISHQIMPALINQTRKGQKTLLGDAISLGKIKACLAGMSKIQPVMWMFPHFFLAVTEKFQAMTGLYFTGKKKVRIAV